jgi:hypothetical protein
MALPPKFSGQLLASASSAEAKHTIELYLDYVCPFSAKIFKTFYKSVVPVIEEKYTKPGIRVIFRQQIQPWHPSSTLTHEAGAAVLRTAPNAFWAFSEKLFEHQKEYFDVNVVSEGRNETYKRLAKLAGSVEGVEEQTILDLLTVPDKPDKDGGLNIGNSKFTTMVLCPTWSRSCLSPVVPGGARLMTKQRSPTMSSSWSRPIESPGCTSRRQSCLTGSRSVVSLRAGHWSNGKSGCRKMQHDSKNQQDHRIDRASCDGNCRQGLGSKHCMSTHRRVLRLC